MVPLLLICSEDIMIFSRAQIRITFASAWNVEKLPCWRVNVYSAHSSRRLPESQLD